MKTVIGLEIHAQLATKSKMFCACANDSENSAPNTNICPYCLGLPGVLPVLNKKAVAWGIKTALAVNSAVQEFCKFDRKNYFYPDLPKGYQISQYDEPLAKGGYLEIDLGGKTKKIRLNRIHLEEDAAKLTHPTGRDYSLVDYNRAATPLMEIVTEPDISSPAEAKVFMQEVQKILRHLKVSKADMEKGHLRADANISVNPDKPEAGYKPFIVELKNVNSFRSLEHALVFEEKRLQKMAREDKMPEGKATRGWNEKGETFEQRVKETSSDYRYFPEPDLPPLTPDQEWIQQIKNNLGFMPNEIKSRFQKEYGLAAKEADVLSRDIALSQYFENVVNELEIWVADSKLKTEDEIKGKLKRQLVKLACNWILSELLKYLKAEKKTVDQIKISPENFAELIKMVHEKQVNSSAAQTILKEMYKTGGDPSHIAEDKDLSQVSDAGALLKIIDNVLQANPGPAADFKSGKENALQFLIGQVMKESKGKANPGKVQDLLREQLKQ